MISLFPNANYTRFVTLTTNRTLSCDSIRNWSTTHSNRRRRTPNLHPLSMSIPSFSVTRALESNSSNGHVNVDIDVDVDADANNYTEIVVVRHGETEWNADGRIQGHLDVELNGVGRQQAAAVASRLSLERKPAAIYSSDLKRAFETAQAIATACACSSDCGERLELEVIKDPDLRERNLGDLQGRTLRNASITCPEAYKAFMSNRTDQQLPGGGESIDQLYERCTTSLQNIGRKHRGQRAIVVTHGGVIRSLHRRARPSGRPGKILNTSVNVFHLSDDGDKWVIESWGDVSHLDQKTGFLKTGFGGDATSG